MAHSNMIVTSQHVCLPHAAANKRRTRFVETQVIQ